MADQKLTALTENTTPALADIAYIVDDPAGTPASQKISLSTLADLFTNNSIYRQAIINGNFDVWQRGTSFVSGANGDDVYTADRWNLISDGNDIVDVTLSTTVPDGSKYAMRLEVETAEKKFGVVQFIENLDAMKLDNKTVSVSFQAKATGLENLRCAVLSWSSTADSITSDVVSDWAAEGTNPTWAANWTAENTATNIAITGDYATYTVTGIDIDTPSTANLAVVIWLDDTDSEVNDRLYLSQVQLCAGDVALPFMPKSYEDELRACQRYYEKSFNSSTAPVNQTVAASQTCAVAYNTTNLRVASVAFKVRKRTTPTITFYSDDNCTADSLWAYYSGSWTNGSGTTASDESEIGTGIAITGTFTAGNAYMVSGHWTADAEL